MAWKVELTPLAEKSLDKLDPKVARRILSCMDAWRCSTILAAWARR
jgi:mRNA-degrading endonuclease RelE of RelBE toxin-antitoxin system